MLLKDARDYQLLFLSSFLLLGISTRGWDLTLQHVIVAIATCLLSQWCLEVGRFGLSQLKIIRWEIGSLVNWGEWRTWRTLGRKEWKGKDTYLSSATSTIPFSVRSPLITALSLSLLLRSDHEVTMLLAGMVAIASKFFLRVDGKHCFNPANIGIIAALVLTHDAWISPGQWGEDIWYVLLFVGAGGMVLKQVGRWDTSLAFLGTYASLLGLRVLWLGWTWDVWYHQLMSGSLLLFALFMLTDPRSIPNTRTGRIVWSMAIALVAFILQTCFFISAAPFWALFFIAPSTLVIDQWWKGNRFQWTSLGAIGRSRITSTTSF